MSTNGISEFINKFNESQTQRKKRIDSTIYKFSQISGLINEDTFAPAQPNNLYLSKKSNFLNGYKISSVNNIYGELRRVNDLQSILDALEINFKIRLDFQLTLEEKENYKNKIKNIVLSRYYLLSHVKAEERLIKYAIHKHCEAIRNIWTQLETDLIYQLTVDEKPDKILEDISLNKIENDVNLWLETYENYYLYYNQNRFLNEIVMNYPTEKILKKNIAKQEILKSSNIKLNLKPYAKDLLEDRNKLFQFRRSMKDTSFWSTVLKCIYDKRNKSLDEDIENVYKPHIKLQTERIKEYEAKPYNEENPSRNNFKKHNKNLGRPSLVNPIDIFRRIIEKRKELDEANTKAKAEARTEKDFTVSDVNRFIIEKEFGLSKTYLRSKKPKKYLSCCPALKDRYQSEWQKIITEDHIDQMQKIMGEQKN